MLLFSGYVFSERCFSIIGDMLFVQHFCDFYDNCGCLMSRGKKSKVSPKKRGFRDTCFGV